MNRIHSFTPVCRNDAVSLVLGTMPGKASLQADQYYAHPRNAFWRIMSELFDIRHDASYEQRCQSLIDNQIALWDVLSSCDRRSSLDADIVESSMQANDIPAFLQQHAQLEHIYFNGAKAEQVFRRQLLPTIKTPLQLMRLPSTSPAHAAMSLEQKLEQWRVITDG